MAQGAWVTHENLVFATLAATIALFIANRIRIDLVALSALMVLTVGGVLTTSQALAGFSDPIVIVIAALFVVGEGLSHTGIAARVAQWPAPIIGDNETRAIVVLMLLSSVLSAFMSSTGAVAVMIPVAIGIARSSRISAPKLLMPMAFAAQMGGMLTLIGTPPNLLASAALQKATGQPFGFFEITPYGLAALLTGLVFMVVFGRKLLPGDSDARAVEDLPSVIELAQSFDLPAWLRRARIPADSPLVGKSLCDAEVRARHFVNVVFIERHPDGPIHRPPYAINPGATTVLEAGDVLTMRGVQADLQTFEAFARLEPLDGLDGVAEATSDFGVVEVILTPESRFQGKSLCDVRFRDRFGASVLAIKRKGQLLPGRVSREILAFGDSLLVAGPWKKIEELRDERREFIVAREPAELSESTYNHKRAPVAAAVVVLMLVAMALGRVPVVSVALLAALAMALTGTVRVASIYRSINWPSLVLIAAMLPMATALEVSGGVNTLVGILSGVTVGLSPAVALGVMMLATSLLTQLISNTATAVLMAPIAVQLAGQAGTDPAPLLMGVAIAASTAYATPVASPVNTLVLGAGNYRFSDYLKCGVPLQLTVLAVTWALILLLSTV